MATGSFLEFFITNTSGLVVMIRPLSLFSKPARSALLTSLTLVLGIMIAPSARAGTILVPADVATIQGAIDLAFDGDTVQVAPGTYFENLDFLGKAITVTSEAGPETTIVDAGGLDRVVAFTSGEGLDSVLDGFTLQNGSVDGLYHNGGGIFVWNSSPTITRNWVINNMACNGAGIAVRDGSPNIISNVIRNNLQFGCSGFVGGGGIRIFRPSTAQIIDNVISDNVVPGGMGGGIMLFGADNTTVKGNTITGNSAANEGGAIFIASGSNDRIIQNLMFGNTAHTAAAISWRGSGPFLLSNTIADNVSTTESETGSTLVSEDATMDTNLINNLIIAPGGDFAISCGINSMTQPTLSYNNVFSAQGLAFDSACFDQTGIDGNISEDPDFVDAASGDYRLSASSRSLDAGDETSPELPAVDFNGDSRLFDGDNDGFAAVDMGAFEFQDQPVANAGLDQTVRDFEVATLDGTASFDPLGGALSYLWTLDGAEVANTVTPNVGPIAAGSYNFTLTVTDQADDSSSDAMVLTVLPPNQPPIANAGPDQTTIAVRSVNLDGSGSFDPDSSSTLSYVWRLDGVQIATGSAAVVGPFALGTYSITLTVTDGDGDSDSDSMVLSVINQPPVANAGPDQTIRADLMANLNGSWSYDTEGSPLTFVWTLDGMEIATGPMPSVGPLAVGTYTLVLTVTDDGGASSSDSLILTVLPPNEAPIADAGPDRTIRDVDTLTLYGLGSSDPDGTVLAYVWTLDGIVVGTGPRPRVGPFAAGSHTITLTVTDLDGATASDTVTITVHQIPVANAGPNQIVGEGDVVSLDGSASFDPDGGALTYSWFSDGTEISTEATLTVGPLALGLHVFSLRVLDPDGAVATDSVEVAVTTPGHVPIEIPGAIRVPDDQPTLRDAIDVAVDGDTILVSPGLYSEQVRYNGKAITLISEFGPELTVIGGAVIFITEGEDSVLQGFTIQDGGGISIQAASPKIIGNRILENNQCRAGGIQILVGSPLIQDNIISGNTAFCSDAKGGGIGIVGRGSAQILDNVISNNFSAGNGGGISVAGPATPTIRGNLIEENQASAVFSPSKGGGIYMADRTSPLVVQNVIVDNSADEAGGVYWDVPVSGPGPRLVNNTIADNIGTQVLAAGFNAQSLMINNTVSGTEFGIVCGAPSDTEPPILLSNNAVGATGQAYAGLCAGAAGIDGNISTDPLFVDSANGDYRPQDISPLVDAGDNLAPGLLSTDADGTPRIVDGDGDGIARIDMGAFEFGTGPVANAGPDQEVTDLDTVVLDGTGSFDPAGGPLVYDWSLDGSPLAMGPTPTVGRLPPGTHRVVLTVTDGNGAATADIMILTILGENQPPVADAGSDQTLPVFATTTLDGTGSFDPEGEALSFFWVLDGINIATGPSPTVGPFSEGLHTITLVVADSLDSITMDSVVLTVTNAPPVASVGPSRTMTIQSLSTVTLDGSGSSDPEGGPLTYEWTLDGAVIGTGVSPTVGPFPIGLHRIFLAVTDSEGARALNDLMLTVQNQAPVADAGPDITIQALETVTLDGSGSFDPEGQTIIYYHWRFNGTFIATDIAPTVGPFPAGTHTITLNISDNNGGFSSDSMSLTVQDDSVPDTDFLVHLPLDEGSGTAAVDVSGFNNNGTLVNGPAYEAATADSSAYSLRFDGSNDFIDLGRLDVTGASLTLAAWFNADSFPGSSRDPRLISKANGTSSNSHVFMLSTIKVGSATRLRARVGVGGVTKTLIASSGDLQTGVWHHAATTYDGTTLRLYLDAVEVGSTPLSGAVGRAAFMSVAVGAQPPGAGGRHFDGLIDDVRILQRALSLGEISSIVGAGSSNLPPVAVDDGYATTEDAALAVAAVNGLLANDTDPDLDPLQAALVGDVSNGTLTLNADGSFDYTPAADFNGADSFTYRVGDGTAFSNPATVTLTVSAVNDAPLAADNGYQTQPDTALTVNVASGVLSTDSDPDQDPLQAVLVDDVASGILLLNGDGSFTYTPNAGFSGSDGFTYRANDGSDDSNLATVTISVVEVLDPHLLVSLPLDEGGGLVAGDASGMGNDGALAGGAVFEANTADGSAFAVRLDGANDFIDLGVLDVTGTGLTLATWFNADSFPGSARDPRLISKASGTAGNAHLFMLSTIQVGSATRLRARVRVGGSTTTLIASSGNLQTGQWHHAAVTHDGSTLRLYLDGAQVGSTSLNGTVDVDPSLAVAVGAQPPGAGGKYFDGLVDDVRILSRAMSAAEVGQIGTGGS